MKPWPKFIRSIDTRSTVWSVYSVFDVTSLKTITVNYTVTSGSEKLIYGLTNTEPIRENLKSSGNLKYDLQETSGTITKTFDVSEYKYFILSGRESGKMQYDIISAT